MNILALELYYYHMCASCDITLSNFETVVADVYIVDWVTIIDEMRSVIILLFLHTKVSPLAVSLSSAC